MNDAIKEGRRIEVLPFEEFLSILDIKEEDIINLPERNAKFFLKKASKGERKCNNQIEKHKTYTFDEALRAKGIDLNSILDAIEDSESKI